MIIYFGIFRDISCFAYQILENWWQYFDIYNIGVISNDNEWFLFLCYLMKVNQKQIKNNLSDLKIIWYVRISRFSLGTSGRGGNEAVKRWPLNIAFPPKYNFPDKGVCISRRNQNDFPLNHLNLQCSTRRAKSNNQLIKYLYIAELMTFKILAAEQLRSQ